MSNRYRGPSIDASYQVSYHLAKQFQRKSCLWWPCLLTDWDKMSSLYNRIFHRCFLPSFGSFGHVVSEEKIFRNRPIRNKNRLWWPRLLMELERNEYSLQRTAHRCFLPSFRSFGQAVSEEKIFKNRPIRNKNCMWWPCLLMDRDKISSLYRGPSIYASYQVSVHMVEGFQKRRLKCEKLTDDGRQVMAKAHLATKKKRVQCYSIFSFVDQCFVLLSFSTI